MTSTPGPIGSKRVLFWAVLVLTPFLLLAFLEGVFRLAGVARPEPLFNRAIGQGVDGYITNPEVGKRYFPPSMRANMPRLGFQYFPREKDPQTFRIFSLGGSSTAGFPYHAHASFTGILGARLELLVPDRRFETVNCAMTAVNSHAAIDFIPEILEHDPDLVLIYMGHNEFYGAGGVGSISSLGRTPALVPWVRSLLKLRVAGLLRGALGIGYARGSSGPGRNVMETMAAEREIPYGSPLRRAAAEIYERNLTQIVRRCQKRGVPVLLCEVSSNLRTQVPFGSAHAPGFAQEGLFLRFLSEAEAMLKKGELDRALASIERAAGLDSAYAEARYLKGRILDARGKTDDARREYRAARELDTIPFRAPDELNRVIHKVAAACGIPLVPVDSLLSAASPGGIPGDEFFLEHLHFKAQGNDWIARALAMRICDEGWVAPREQWRWNQELPPVEYMRQAGVTELDLEIGDQRVHMLRQKWPYVRTEREPQPYQSRRAPKIAELADAFVHKRIELPEAHNALGRYFQDKGDVGRALAEYLSSFRMFPLDPAPAVTAGELWLRLAQPARAGRLFAQALNLQPDDERTLLLLAQVQMGAGKTEEAARLISRALEINPQSQPAQKLREAIAARTGRR